MRTIVFVSFLMLFKVTYSQVTIEKLPQWIVEETYNTEVEIPAGGVNGGAQVLLFTEQVHVDLEEVFIKSVAKALDHNGIQGISTVSAEYDPSYQKLRFHEVAVVRDGKTINRLNQKDIQTARRETNSESFMYDGTITAFMNIPDVRVGDITLFSYSIKGFNPIQPKFTRSFVLNSTEYMNRISNHIFSSRKLRSQIFNSEVRISEKSMNGVTHYTWIDKNVPALAIDENVPFWHIQNATAFFSEYESWAEVIDWGNRLFSFNEPANQELNTIATSIMNEYNTEGARILAALRFVQNEVRYLALSSGIGGYQPNSPNTVVKQRFGDCKDKSVLLTTLLHKMNVEAYPTLVNTGLKRTLTELMPSSKIFDHCIVKVVDKKGTNLWYDPTLVNQGGGFLNTYIPDYQFGLVLDERLSTLDTISNFQNNLVETFSTIKINKIGEGAELEIRSHYHEGEADYIRSIIKNNNKDMIDKELLSFATQNYGRTSSKAPFTFVDDSLKNEVALLERYHLDSIWKKSSENRGNINFSIIPFSITSVLSMPTQLERFTPYAMSYPMVRKHNFEVKLPERIQVRPESFTINSDYFYYDYNSTYDTSSNTLNLSFYYKNQSDHVPAADFNTFYSEMVQLDNNIGYLITSNKAKGWGSPSSAFSLGSVLLYGLALMGIVALVIGAIVLLVRKMRR